MKKLNLEEALQLEIGTEVVIDVFQGMFKGKELATVVNFHDGRKAIQYKDGTKDIICEIYNGYGLHSKEQYGVIYIEEREERK